MIIMYFGHWPTLKFILFSSLCHLYLIYILVVCEGANEELIKALALRKGSIILFKYLNVV